MDRAPEPRLEALRPLLDPRAERSLFEQGVEIALSCEPTLLRSLIDAPWLDRAVQTALALRSGHRCPTAVVWKYPLTSADLPRLAEHPEVQSVSFLRDSRPGGKELPLPPMPWLRSMRFEGPWRVDLRAARLEQLTALRLIDVEAITPADLPSLRSFEAVSFRPLFFDLLQRCPGLVELSIASTPAGLPERFSLKSMRRLEALTLEACQLQTIPDGLCGLNRLRKLNLSNNLITELPAALSRLTNLEVLSLSSNRIRSIPPELGALTNLRRVRLNVNRLSTLPAPLSGWRRLQRLFLSQNPLRVVPEVLLALPRLQVLDISRTLIDALPSSPWPRLHDLNVRRTPLRSFPGPNAMIGLRQVLIDRDQHEVVQRWARSRCPRLRIRLGA